MNKKKKEKGKRKKPIVRAALVSAELCALDLPGKGRPLVLAQ